MMTGAVFLFVLTAIGFAAPAVSQPHPLAAVGKIESPDTSGCSAVLISHDTVLTAAHCVAKRGTSYTFSTARYPGIPSVTVQVAVFAQHPIYALGIGNGASRLRIDLALLRLVQPIESSVAIPVPIGPDPKTGEVFHLASYPGATGARARERKCEGLEQARGILTVGCAVRGGESGAPVLRLSEEGPEVVAIMTARGKTDTQPIGLAVLPQAHLESLEAALEAVERAASGGS